MTRRHGASCGAPLRGLTRLRARDPRPLLVAALALALAGVVLVSSPATADPTVTARPKPAFSQTKTLQRVFDNGDGTTYAFPERQVTVTADQTQDLRGRQRVEISWSGAQPSGGRASNPYGENGLQQEYPVVVMQCRGVDDPSLPAAQQVAPSTCWTTSVAQRSQVSRTPAEATWTRDLLAADADRERVSGVTPFPTADTCPTADIAPFFTRLTPFVARDRTVHLACDAAHMPPEAAVGAAFPPHELAAFTDADGTGSVQFEVRSEAENESLGCNERIACSIVVIPIMGLSCAAPATPPTPADAACRKGGRFLPGSSNFAAEGVDQAVSPSLWWSASNWDNRFTIPITFGLPPDACDVLDDRAPTGFYGSELLAQAALQWSPAYCLDESRFKFQLNQMSDDAGWNLMEAGEGAAAEVSSEHERRGSDPVGYAPTAVTGFGIGYVIDRPDNQGEYDDLRLNARLVAKLLTQSYLGSDLGRGHPGIGENPLSIMTDPEFQRLNPGLSTTSQEAGAALLQLSSSSDVVEQLTGWIAQDPQAVAFVSGESDPWGMRVNPAYEDISLPRAEWPLLDTFVPQTQNTCRQENPAVYFTQVAAPVTTLRKVAEALLDGWPNVQTRCEFDQSTQQYKLGRIDRQSFGSRFVLGLVSLGDLERYGLRAAALETAKNRYVEPDDASLAAAVALGEQAEKLGPFVLDQADVRRSTRAYPGTMVVYTAAKTSGLDQPTADKVAQFVRVSTTEGQVPGSGNGELPAGYLPIRRTGVTAALFDSAQRVAAAIEAQAPASSPAPPPGGDAGGGGTAGGGAGLPGPSGDDAGGVPDSEEPTGGKAAPSTERADAATQAVAMPATTAISSRWSGGVLPSLLLIGLLGVAVASILRFFLQPVRGATTGAVR
ncbi:hypothetical protein [Nocardioides kribbensis]|uniref:hypothetical protein n=1 Tax=Nocardioides kribbensis TaxID=305517 RepID=UPI0018790C06|nr:hypothetical protein [Nocardioides kribbensis]